MDSTRNQIINAALKLFGEVGYKRATTRMIAAEGGVNEVTIFRHFGSKKKLLLACAEEFIESGFAANFEQQLTGNYAQDIAMMGQSTVNEMVKRFGLVRLMMCDAIDAPEILKIITHGPNRNQDLVAEYFQQQIDAGIVRADLDPVTLAAAFDSLFSASVFFNTIFAGSSEPALPSPETIQQLADIFVRGTKE